MRPALAERPGSKISAFGGVCVGQSKSGTASLLTRGHVVLLCNCGLTAVVCVTDRLMLLGALSGTVCLVPDCPPFHV